MVSLKRLDLNDFRTFEGAHTVVFAGGLTILKGANLETGGGSGAGKTNVIHALQYLLGRCSVAGSALQNWNTAKKMSVTGTFDADGREVVVRRQAHGKKLSITVDGIEQEGAVAELEAVLDRIMGVGSALREILSYRDQKDPKTFLKMGDAQMKEFLTRVLGLEGLEAEIDRANDRVKDGLEKFETARAARDQRQAALADARALAAAATAAIEDEGPLLAEMNQARDLYDDVKVKSETATLLWKRAKEAEEVEAARVEAQALAAAAVLDVKIQKADEIIVKLVDADRVESKRWHADVRAREQELADLDRNLALLRNEVKALDQLRREQVKLESATCPTCEQTWVQAAKRLAVVRSEIERLGAAEVKAASMAQTLEVGRLELAAIIPHVTDPRISKMEKAREDLRRQRAVIAAEARAKALEVLQDPSRTSASLGDEMATWGRQLLEAEGKLARARAALASCRRQNESERQRTQAVAQRISELENRVEAITAGTEATERVWKEEVDYEALLKSFRNKIFDEVLQAIGAEATNIIASLPNAQHIAVEFRTEKETKKATVQERITPYVTVYGESRPLNETLSGGQLTSLSLAVDLAIFRVVGARMGSKINWLVFDESFDGLDPVTKVACLEMLQQYAADKLVLIVDHTTEFKEYFNQTITIEYKDQKSRIA